MTTNEETLKNKRNPLWGEVLKWTSFQVITQYLDNSSYKGGIKAILSHDCYVHLSLYQKGRNQDSRLTITQTVSYCSDSLITKRVTQRVNNHKNHFI